MPNIPCDIETNKGEETNISRAESVSEISFSQASPCGSDILPEGAHQHQPPPTQFYEPRREYRSPPSYGLNAGIENPNQMLLDSHNSLGLAIGDYESNFQLPFFEMQLLDHQLGETSNSIQTQAFGITPESIAQSSGSFPQDENSSAMSTSNPHWPSLPSKTSHPSEDHERQIRRSADTHGFSDLPGGLFDELYGFLFPSTYIPLGLLIYYITPQTRHLVRQDPVILTVASSTTFHR